MTDTSSIDACLVYAFLVQVIIQPSSQLLLLSSPPSAMEASVPRPRKSPIRKGDKVLLQRMREAVDGMGCLLYDDEKLVLIRSERKVGVVEKILLQNGSKKVKEYEIRMKNGHSIVASPRFVVRCNDCLTLEGLDLCVMDRCRHLNKAGTFMVTQVTPQRIHLQNEESSARLICDPTKVVRIASNAEEAGAQRKTVWREYQQDAIEEMLQRRRSVCFLRPGGGKTLIVLGAFLRMKFDPKCSVKLQAGDICLVITEASLVDEVWARQAYEHGVFDHLHVARGREAPPAYKQLVVVSIQYLSSYLMKQTGVFNDRECTLWHRRVSAVFTDEVHRLGGKQVWNSSVAKLTGSAVLAAGLTGTFFPNDPGNAANISIALGLHKDLQKAEFWHQPMALELATGSEYMAVHRPPDESTRAGAPTREQNPRWRREVYQARPERSPGQPIVNSICECLEISPSKAREFHNLASEADKSRCFDNNNFASSSKISVFLAAVERLFKENKHKIFVTMLYLDVLLIVKKFLARRYGSEGRVKIFEYHGKLSSHGRKAHLKAFLERHSCSSTRSIMLFSLCAGKTGLNITNGVHSPTAHIEFEQAHLASDRFQLQCRVDRDGNAHPVQLVALEGENTEESLKMDRHWSQAKKQKLAGCGEMVKALFKDGA